MQRADRWRARLDSTTNWAVVSSAAALTVAFSEPRSGPILLPLTTVLVTLFLWIEGRRYRYFELWSRRVRCLEKMVFTPMLLEQPDQSEEWRQRLAETLEDPTFPISAWEAFGRRYRSIYVWLQLILAVSWVVHVWRYPDPAASWFEVLNRTVIGELDTAAFFALGALFQLALLAIGLGTRRLRHAEGDVV